MPAAACATRFDRFGVVDGTGVNVHESVHGEPRDTHPCVLYAGRSTARRDPAMTSVPRSARSAAKVYLDRSMTHWKEKELPDRKLGRALSGVLDTTGTGTVLVSSDGVRTATLPDESKTTGK